MCVLVLSHFSRVQLYKFMDHSPPGFSVHGDSPGKNTEMGCHALEDPGLKTASLTTPVLVGRFFTTALSGKPQRKTIKNITFQMENQFQTIKCKSLLF